MAGAQVVVIGYELINREVSVELFKKTERYLKKEKF